MKSKLELFYELKEIKISHVLIYFIFSIISYFLIVRYFVIYKAWIFYI